MVAVPSRRTQKAENNHTTHSPAQTQSQHTLFKHSIQSSAAFHILQLCSPDTHAVQLPRGEVKSHKKKRRRQDALVPNWRGASCQVGASLHRG